MKNRIILVPFPFDDLSGSKMRPALCLTNPVSACIHIVISFITSQLNKATEPTDISLLTTDVDFKLTGLKVDSAVRLHRLVTIPTYLIQRQLSILPTAFHAALEQKLRALFGI